MPRPAIPQHLRRTEYIFTAFRKNEAAAIDALRKEHKIRSRAGVVREAMLSILENRPPSWENK